jgi:type IV secretory pathway VirB2 component (pilin)
MKTSRLNRALKFGGALALISTAALAAPTAANANLPWETAITTIYASVTGPLALGVAGVAFVAAGGVLVFGGDVPEFGRRIAYLAMVGAILVGAPAILSALFNAGAMVG